MAFNKQKFELISQEADLKATPLAQKEYEMILNEGLQDFVSKIIRDPKNMEQVASKTANSLQENLDQKKVDLTEKFVQRGFELSGQILEIKQFAKAGPVNFNRKFYLNNFLNVKLSNWLQQTSKIETESSSNIFEKLWKTAVEAGLTHASAFSKMIMDFGLTQNKVRAKIMARTTSIYSYNAGSVEQYKQNGIEKKEWVVALDDATCPICSKMDNKIITINGLFAKEGIEGIGDYTPGIDVPHPPLHPNCLVGDTPVFATDVISGYSSTYVGTVIDIVTESGRRITVTPNHPLLSPTGFIAAKDITQGDNLLYYSVSNDAIKNPDNHNRITTISEIISSLPETFGMSSITMPSTTKDFHGDGGTTNSNINIVSSTNFLSGKIDSFQSENIGKLGFVGTDIFSTSLSSVSNLSAELFALGCAANGVVSSGNTSTSSLTSGKSSLDDIGFTLISSDDSVFSENSSNNTSGTVESFGKFEFADTGNIKIDNVISVCEKQFSGQVYNLQTLSGLYLANGLITGNCRCAIAPFLD
jgi:hypothetical protein